MAELIETDIREKVRERYAAAATAVAESTSSGCCGAPAAIDGCGPDISSRDKQGNVVFGAVLYLGSGAGADVLISARRVGATGRAIGLDMTDEMLDLARANAAEAGVENVEFVKGYIQELPLADDSVDVIISN